MGVIFAFMNVVWMTRKFILLYGFTSTHPSDLPSMKMRNEINLFYPIFDWEDRRGQEGWKGKRRMEGDKDDSLQYFSFGISF